MTDKDKLERMKKLADGMYYAAQYLTTDASKLRNAMEDYHQFIITEYTIKTRKSDMKNLTKEEKEAKEYCKNVGIKDGYQDCWIINFKSHPTKFKNDFIGEVIELNYGYGIKRFYPRMGKHLIEADEDKNGNPIPYNSYWEALKNLGITRI